MDFNEYQAKARTTAVYTEVMGKNFIYPVIGLFGETGEVAEKIKKILRDKNGQVTDEDRVEIKKELGDVLWYLSNLSTELGLSLNDIAETNITKLASRKDRNMIHGKGDNR